MKTVKLKPCKKCGSKNIRLWDCGYSSFNPGGGECLKCHATVKGEAGCLPTSATLASIWNKGQKLMVEEKLRVDIEKLRAENKRLRARLRGMKDIAAGVQPSK